MEKLFNDFDKLINGEDDEIAKENANMDSDTPAGMMMKFASEISKQYTKEHLLSPEFKELHEEGLIHIHDMDYYPTRSLTCIHQPLDKIFKNGTRAGHCAIRPSKRIETVSAIATVMLQGVQNEMHGGQSIPAFDFYFAPYVRMAFEEELYKMGEGTDWVVPEYTYVDGKSISEGGEINFLQIAINRTVKRVHQAMESFIHNMNTMHSRGGNQVVFSSINYGTDTSPEGRCVIRELLNATYEGVGNGETAIFPIQILKIKKGVNKEQGDPNYDLFELACKVTARRFYPNFLNLDASFNKDDAWDANDPLRYNHEVATMGCRTRVYEDLHGDKTSIGRGNLSFTTVNLPGIAFRTKDNKDTTAFFDLLGTIMDKAAKQLYERYLFQTAAKKKQFPMLMSGLWVGSDDLKQDDYIGELLKHGTLGIGFIGLAECLILLTGKHHGEDEKAQKLGIKILTYMNTKIEEYKVRYGLNYSVLATPAEGLSGRFTKIDRAKFGVVERVTDKDYYTNSNHVPVWYNCTAKHKSEVEGAYHKLTKGGHIFYVELDGDATNNPEAIMKLVKLMDKNDLGYMALNHTRNRCMNCGHEDATKNITECPVCGSSEIDTIQRITGYLVGTTSRWNNAKKAELKDRVVHGKD
jgi:ribonucleoside-triphosphate reductase